MVSGNTFFKARREKDLSENYRRHAAVKSCVESDITKNKKRK